MAVSGILQHLLISIHALREEGDMIGFSGTGKNGISIHALREEGDGYKTALKLRKVEFLSTPSARRATSRPRR